ncbi:MAG: hypothetical protein ACI83P_002038 [Janthinobacterium sp.]|jgi:hypothetical protein
MNMDNTQPSMLDSEASELSSPARFRARAWDHLETPSDVELWIAEHNQSMQENIGSAETGYGICFDLTEGGRIFLQTSADGAVILDVTPDAQWVAPLICAVAQVEPPVASIWILPDDILIQLVLGLSSLISTSLLVVGHQFRARNNKMPVPRRF